MTSRRGPLIHRSAVLAGVMAPLFCVLSNAVTVLVRGPLSLLQDFYIFWAAARVLDQGGNPYDSAALAATLKAEGIQVLLGTGYSYPLLLAELLRPIGLLDPARAGAVFVAVSSVGLGIGVALLAGSVRNLRWWVAAPMGILAGLFPPVSFGMFEGQSNLLVLPFLALAYREVAPGAALAVATAVKLYPAGGFAALLGARRWRDVAQGMALTAVLIAGPALLGGPRGSTGQSVSRLGQLLAPDSYYTNMSVNGFLSRAVFNPGWPLRDVPVLFADAALVALLGLVTLAVLWRARFQPFAGALALALWFSTVSAPKNSLWNFVPLLLSLTFVMAAARRHPRAAAVAALGFLLIGLQVVLVWVVTNPLAFRPEVAYRDLLILLESETALIGAMLIGAANMTVLLRDASAGAAGRTPTTDGGADRTQ